MMNRGTTLDIVNPKARYDLMNMINRLKIDTFSIIDFICHLVIDNSESRPSIGCSQQLTLMFNMLDNDLVAYSLFERILGGDADKTNMWDNLIIFLPGGLGTIDEIFTSIESKRANEHDNDIIIVNFNNYYDDLIKQLNKMYKEKFADSYNKELYYIADNIDEVISYIEEECMR